MRALRYFEKKGKEMTDPFMLARIQFAANITFHILFPTITIALCWILLLFKVMHSMTGQNKWQEAYQFWVKIFALCFAMGVVSGITMSFQFGTNWPGFMETVGNIAGPLLAYEVLTAFFLEATFLGVMLFGGKKVSNKMHTLATFLVAIGTTLSAFWILALNSWMQTPAGFEIVNGKAFATNWWHIVFNPSMPYRMLHMLVASGITAAFFVAGVSAYRWQRGDHAPSVKSALKMGLYMAAILIPVQIFIGDLHGLNTLKHQPAKVAAMEGLWETRKEAPLLLFSLPDENLRTNHFELAIPKAASLILTHDVQGEVRGLNDFKGAHPPVAPVFWAFRLMVGVGVLMLVLSWWAGIQLWRKGALDRFLTKACVAMTFSGWVATLAGWYVTEIGRQPYLVYGVLTTAQAVSKVPRHMVATSLFLYITVYAVLLLCFISTIFYLARKAYLTQPLRIKINVPQGGS